MHIERLDILRDERSDCFSVMTNSNIGSYIAFIQRTYNDKGGIDAQREPLKTSSAMRIRRRMMADIISGAILPPIVLGVVLPPEQFALINQQLTIDLFREILAAVPVGNIAIIDGMQRTTAFVEAGEDNIGARPVRVEFWVARNINSLIYRMLVLNTGQVPWNLRRQIEVVFNSMIMEIAQQVREMTIIRIDDKRRRKNPGEFQANDIVELYLTFGARKEVVDTKDRLADEFVRLDFIEATDTNSVTQVFYGCLNFLACIDKQFGRLVTGQQEENANEDEAELTGRFQNGIDLFKSQPARVGFITALGKKILGRPGTNRSEEEQTAVWQQIEGELQVFIERLKAMSDAEIGQFLSFGILNENISRKSSRVGQFEREFFTKAFETLIEEKFGVGDLQVCWRAY